MSAAALLPTAPAASGRAAGAVEGTPAVLAREGSNSLRWTYVCRVDEIVPNTGVCARVGRHQVAVFRSCAPDGRELGIYALDNVDPKSGAAVLSRGLLGSLGDTLVVASPVYKQHYALATGTCLEDPTLSVAAHAVRVHEGLILVQEPA